jgi:hypothetical protein
LFWELGVSDPLEALRCCREGRRILFSSEHESPELARQCYQESAVVSSGRETKDACQLGVQPQQILSQVFGASSWFV